MTIRPPFALLTLALVLASAAGDADAANIDVYVNGDNVSVFGTDDHEVFVIERIDNTSGDLLRITGFGNTTVNGGNQPFELSLFGFGEDYLYVSTYGGNDGVVLRNLEFDEVLAVIGGTGGSSDADSIDLVDLDVGILTVRTGGSFVGKAGSDNDLVNSRGHLRASLLEVDTGNGLDRVLLGEWRRDFEDRDGDGLDDVLPDPNDPWSADLFSLLVRNAETVVAFDMDVALDATIRGGFLGDRVTLDNIAVGGDLVVRTLAGRDLVTVDDVLVDGDVILNLGDTGNLNTDKDELLVDGLVAEGGTTSIVHGVGTSAIELVGVDLLELAITTGDGPTQNDDYVRIEDSFAWGVDFDLGAGDDRLDATGLLTAYFVGSLGNGRDTLYFGNNTLLMVGGSFYFSVNGDAGTDTAIHDRPNNKGLTGFERINP